ncbi:ABC transporter permease [Acetobacteraceae bacterium H6797]|nr:ABC transporter permease [Acetobacteraceae bacterium H6797]
MIAVCLHELRRIMSLKPVFSVLILAAVVYAGLYPQPYLGETLRHVPIAVVDQDNSPSSRALIRRIAAAPDLAIAILAPDLPAAESAVWSRTVHGILLIPKGFEADLLHGRPSPVSLHADASYFLIYSRIVAGVTGATKALAAEVSASRLVATGIDPVVAMAGTDPLRLTAVPLFNPEGGYATYVLPAALVLIVQQLLLMGVGLLATLPGQPAAKSTIDTVLGRLLAYVIVEAAIVPLYLIGLPWLYGLPRLGSVVSILLIALPFILAVSAMGLALGSLLRHPLAVQLVLGIVGLPFFFLAGFAWPAEAIQPAINWLARLLPSTLAIDGFARASSLGAPIDLLGKPMTALWGLALAYILAAILLGRRRHA